MRNSRARRKPRQRRPLPLSEQPGQQGPRQQEAAEDEEERDGDLAAVAEGVREDAVALRFPCDGGRRRASTSTVEGGEAAQAVEGERCAGGRRARPSRPRFPLRHGPKGLAPSLPDVHVAQHTRNEASRAFSQHAGRPLIVPGSRPRTPTRRSWMTRRGSKLAVLGTAFVVGTAAAAVPVLAGGGADTGSDGQRPDRGDRDRPRHADRPGHADPRPPPLTPPSDEERAQRKAELDAAKEAYEKASRRRARRDGRAGPGRAGEGARRRPADPARRPRQLPAAYPGRGGRAEGGRRRRHARRDAQGAGPHPARVAPEGGGRTAAASRRRRPTRC